MDNNELLESKCRELRELSQLLALQYIRNAKVRVDFLNEINRVIEESIFDVKSNCSSTEHAISNIQQEIDELLKQRFKLIAGEAQQFAYVEAQKREKYVTLVLKQLGFIGGGMQTFTGGVVCYGSLGLACASFGIPMMAQGTNNLYENGYYLLYRKDASGYVRDGYRHIAAGLGYSDTEADIVYAAVDLGLSGYGVFRKTAIPGKLKLFKHINSDFLYGWQEMGRSGLLLESAVDASTIYLLKKSLEDKR
ncbi:DUF4225 domain-containing protein [Enterobacteriaceae bacterium 4M9]|nr:DUF4225 domain-containing protein [Enterobacteriaceae bacterium 4M9]